MFSSLTLLPEPDCRTPSKRPARKAARTPRASLTKIKEAVKLGRNLVKSATLDSQAEEKDRLEENDSLDPDLYTDDCGWLEGGGAQPRSAVDYAELEERSNIEIDEDGKADTTDPGSDGDWTRWMSDEQVRAAYRDLCAVKNILESSANPLQAENLALTSQLLRTNVELQKENIALTSQLLQLSMELRKIKTFMAVAGEKLLKTGGETMPQN